MENKNLGITRGTAASAPKLLARGIQADTLIQLGRVLAAGDDRARDLLEALEDLGRVADGAYREGSLDDALGDVAELGRLDSAEINLSDADVQQLAAQATAALPDEDARPGTLHHLPAQTRRAS